MTRSFPRCTARNLPAAALTLALALGTAAALPAAAQGQTYWLQATVGTTTLPGAGSETTGYLPGETAAFVEQDPAGISWSWNLNHRLYADAHSRVWASQGMLYSESAAVARIEQATYFPPGITASSDSRFGDRIQVLSNTLLPGAPVTLTFRVDTQVGWQGTSLYEGTASCQATVGSVSTTSRWSARYGQAEQPAQSPSLTVHTQVGAKLSVSARLLTSAKASFFVPGPFYEGTMEVAALCATPLESASGDVYLVADSGARYGQTP